MIHPFACTGLERISSCYHRTVGRTDRIKERFLEILRITVRCKEHSVNVNIHLLHIIQSYQPDPLLPGLLCINRQACRKDQYFSRKQCCKPFAANESSFCLSHKIPLLILKNFSSGHHFLGFLIESCLFSCPEGSGTHDIRY